MLFQNTWGREWREGGQEGERESARVCNIPASGVIFQRGVPATRLAQFTSDVNSSRGSPPMPTRVRGISAEGRAERAVRGTDVRDVPEKLDGDLQGWDGETGPSSTRGISDDVIVCVCDVENT